MHGKYKIMVLDAKGVVNNKGKESAVLHNKLKGLINTNFSIRELCVIIEKLFTYRAKLKYK